MTSAAKQRRAPDWYEWDAVQRGRINAPDPRHIRRLTDEKLHELIQGRLEERYRVAIDRELKRRDAWDGPAGGAYWISVLAPGVAGASLLWIVFWR